MRARRLLVACAVGLLSIGFLLLHPTTAEPEGPIPSGRATVDRTDTDTQPQIHLIYVIPRDGADRALDTTGVLRNTASSFNTWLTEQTRGRGLRFDTYRGSPDISFHRLHRTDADIASHGAYVRDDIEAETRAAGFDAPNKIYAVYYDGSSTYSCGGGAYPPELPGNVAALYLRGLPDGPVPCAANRFAGAGDHPEYLEFAMLHEILHTMGFVAGCAPKPRSARACFG